MGTDYYLFRSDNKTSFALGKGGYRLAPMRLNEWYTALGGRFSKVVLPGSIDEMRGRVFWLLTEEFDAAIRTGGHVELTASAVEAAERLTQRLWRFFEGAEVVVIDSDGGDCPSTWYEAGYKPVGNRYEADPQAPAHSYWSDPLAFDKQRAWKAKASASDWCPVLAQARPNDGRSGRCGIRISGDAWCVLDVGHGGEHA